VLAVLPYEGPDPELLEELGLEPADPFVIRAHSEGPDPELDGALALLPFIFADVDDSDVWGSFSGRLYTLGALEEGRRELRRLLEDPARQRRLDGWARREREAPLWAALRGEAGGAALPWHLRSSYPLRGALLVSFSGFEADFPPG
jgi:hypothetical protein